MSRAGITPVPWHGALRLRLALALLALLALLPCLSCSKPRQPAPDVAQQSASPSPAVSSAASPSLRVTSTASAATLERERAPSLERVRLVAQHRLGVPLHPGPKTTQMSGRLTDGSWVSVLERRDSGHWLKVISSAGLEGWITSRYAPEAANSIHAPPNPVAGDSPWSSLVACQKQLPERLARRQAGKARLMSYNLRWFPDGAPGKRAGARPTDIEWLACAIAASNVDVVLLQEIKATARAQRQLEKLTQRLDEHTGGRYRVELDSCPIKTSQHVGMMYDSARVQASGFRDYASVNPHGTACQDQLRPGFGGYFAFSGGLDLHLLSVHLKSGTKRRDHRLRLRSLEGLAQVLSEARQQRADRDLIVGGDLNTMGCPHCSPPISREQERRAFQAILAAQKPALSLVPAEQGCSQYYSGQGGLLDHFVVTPEIPLDPASPKTKVLGFCGDLACRPFSNNQPHPGYQRLSDHCPMVLELTDTDTD